MSFLFNLEFSCSYSRILSLMRKTLSLMRCIQKMTKKQTLTQFFYQYLAISKKKRVPRKDLVLPQSWFSEQNNASSKGNTSLNSCLQTYHFPLNHDIMGGSSGLLRVAIDLHHPKNTSLRKIPIPHCIANPQLQRISEKNRMFVMICS